MDSLRTEEEQLAAIKAFWKNYGSAILLGLVVSLGSVYGYRAWQNHQKEQAQTASALYQELLDIVVAGQGQALTDEQKATFEHLSKTLQTDFESSVYAQFTALFKARNAVVDNDLDTAAHELEWLLLQKPGREIEIVARMRMAQVLLAQGGKEKQTEALELLDQITQPGAFKATYGEVRGDVLLALGRRDEAREAYQSAVDAAGVAGSQRPLAQMKLDDLAERKEISK